MKTRQGIGAVVVVVASLMALGCFGAYQVSPDEAAGAGGLKPTQEDKDAGRVAIAPGFDLKGYKVVTVAKFQVTDPGVKDEGDRRTADAMAGFLQTELARRLRESGLFTRVVSLGDTPYQADGQKTLKIEGTISRLGEGSQVLRAMWGLYGAGSAKAQAETRFLDAQSGQVVIVTADRRQASVGAWGGDTKAHFREAFDDLARDLARFLVRLSKGEAPRP